MSCTTSTTIAKNLTKKLSAKYSFERYSRNRFGDKESVEKYDNILNNVSSIKWLLDKNCGCCDQPLCDFSFEKEDEGYVNDVLQEQVNTRYTELWKGSIWNSNLYINIHA